MTPTFQILQPKMLVGKRLTMSFINNRTPELWKSFMPLRNTVLNVVDSDRYSLQIYPSNFFELFNPATEFEKWAAVEVTSLDSVPDDMKTLIVPGGLYAVFHYNGNPSNGDKVFKEIFTELLPLSGYRLDNRPHFEVLGEKYQNGSDESEEEIWIPIKK